MKPKQMRFDFTAKAREPTNAELMKRLTRVESKLVQLMKHCGMSDDGRDPLPEDAVPAITRHERLDEVAQTVDD